MRGKFWLEGSPKYIKVTDMDLILVSTLVSSLTRWSFAVTY